MAGLGTHGRSISVLWQYLVYQSTNNTAHYSITAEQQRNGRRFGGFIIASLSEGHPAWTKPVWEGTMENAKMEFWAV